MRHAPSALLASSLLLSGCGYTPPPATNTAVPQYEADLGTCSTSGSKAVNARNAKTGLAWFASPVTRWSQIGDRVSACMADKGYGRTRTCTAAELRTGGGNRTVTAAGVRCSDPPIPTEARPAGTSPPEPDAPASSAKKRRS